MTTPPLHPWFGPEIPAQNSAESVNWGLIETALREATPTPVAGSDQPLTIPALIGWSSAAIKTLRPGGNDAEILQIANTSPDRLRNHPRLCMARCQALMRLERWDDMAVELRRLSTLDRPMEPRLVGLAIRTGLSWVLRKKDDPTGLSFENVPNNASDYYFSGLEAASANLSLRLAAQAGTETDAIQWRQKLERYFAITGLQRTPERLSGLAIGALLTARDGKLWKSDGMARLLDLPSQGLVAEGKQVNDLMDSAEGLIDADLEPLRAHLAANRNVIILRAHSGVRLVERALCRAGVPVAVVTNGDFPKPGVRTFLANTASSGMVLLKLVKAVRQKRHVIMLMPDGIKGASFVNRQLFDKTVKIGTGGVRIAQAHPTALYFAYSVLVGHRFHLKFVPGPLIDQATPADAAEAAFVDLYLSGLRQMLEGPAQDLGALGLINCFIEEKP